jgi:hypothetical protein
MLYGWVIELPGARPVDVPMGMVYGLFGAKGGVLGCVVGCVVGTGELTDGTPGAQPL